MTQVALTETPIASERPRVHAAAGPAVRLNTFQILMRRWREHGPYNAGQTMHISGEADLDRWRHAIDQTIGDLGLGAPTLLDHGRKVSYKPVDDILLDRHVGDFQSFISNELNRPFSDSELPIRFTILPRADGSHYLNAMYDHWIGDSRAMRNLMHRIWDRYRNPDGSTSLPPLTLHAPNFNKLYRKHIGYLYRSRAIRESLKNVYRHRSAYRMNLANPLDLSSQMIYTPMPAGLITRLHTFAKAAGASVNDVFLAVLGQVMGQYTEKDRCHRKKKKWHFARNRIGLGTIVDIRDAARQSLDEVFGLYLSSYTVLLDHPETTSVAELTGLIAARTQRIKKTNAAVKGYTALMMARLSWDLLPKLGKRHLQSQLIQKNVPVTAGISNVNMTNSWVDETPAEHHGDGPIVLDYLRISPAGPLLPLVFTLTTIRERLSLCCTYRTTAFSPEQAQSLVREFTRRLGEIVP